MAVHAEIKLITPEWAGEQLKAFNTGNRRMRRWWSEALAQSIKRGEWILTHQGIAFTEDGRLLDGQHRLFAVVLSGVPVEMFVFSNVPNNAFSVIDIGQKRSISDTTGISKRTAEVCRLAAQYTFGGTILPDQVRDVANCGLEEVHERLLQYCNSSRAIYTSAPVRMSACALVMDGHSEDYIFDIYRSCALQNLQDLPQVAYAYLRQVGNGKAATKGASGTKDSVARALKLFNPQNKDLARIQVSESDEVAAVAFIRNLIRRAMQR